MLDRRETMCDRDDDRMSTQISERLTDISLTLSIEGCCGLIEDDEPIWTDKYPSEGKSLLLSTREIDSALPYHPLETLWRIAPTIEKITMRTPKGSQQIP